MKKFINFAKESVIELLFFTAIFLNTAFPTIVSPAIIDEINDGTNISINDPFDDESILTTMLAPAAPERIEQTSPMTSLQIELTLSAFWTRRIACLAPLTFLAAIAVKACGSLDATARPIMSKRTLIVMKIKITNIEIISTAFVSTKLLSNEKARDKNKANNKIFISQILCLFFCFSFFSFIYIKLIKLI